MDVSPFVIPYDINAPADTSLWDGQFQALSIFGIKEAFNQDITNIVSSLERAAAYINQRDLKDNDPNLVELFHKFGNTAWLFLSAIYSSKWDHSLTNDNVSFCDHVSTQFKGRQHKKSKTNTPTNPSQVDSPKAQVLRIPPPIPLHLPTDVQKKVVDQINKNNAAREAKKSNFPPKKSYARAINSASANILKLREAFPSLSANKILDMHKASQHNTNPASQK